MRNILKHTYAYLSFVGSKTIRVSEETLKYLRMAQGVYQATTGRRYTYDKTIREMAASVVYAHAEIASKALKEAQGQAGSSTS